MPTALGKVLTLLQLLFSQTASNKCPAMGCQAIDKVLAGHAVGAFFSDSLIADSLSSSALTVFAS